MNCFCPCMVSTNAFWFSFTMVFICLCFHVLLVWFAGWLLSICIRQGNGHLKNWTDVQQCCSNYESVKLRFSDNCLSRCTVPWDNSPCTSCSGVYNDAQFYIIGRTCWNPCAYFSWLHCGKLEHNVCISRKQAAYFWYILILFFCKTDLYSVAFIQSACILEVMFVLSICVDLITLIQVTSCTPHRYTSQNTSMCGTCCRLHCIWWTLHLMYTLGICWRHVCLTDAAAMHRHFCFWTPCVFFYLLT